MVTKKKKAAKGKAKTAKGMITKKPVALPIDEDNDTFKESGKKPIIAKGSKGDKSAKSKAVVKTPEVKTVSLTPVDDVKETEVTPKVGKDEYGHTIGSSRSGFMNALSTGPKTMKEITDLLDCKSMYNFFRDMNKKGLVIKNQDGKMQLSNGQA